MVEVGGSNPPGPTKRQTLASGGGFLFGAALAADLNRPVRHIPTQEECGRRSKATAPRRGESARGNRA